MAVKVIYASDLDNTLIFSEEFAQKNNSETENEIVDTYKTGHSVMSKAVRNKLRSLTENKSLQFVPVTTRDDKQYKRVNLGVKPEYAIVANGGIILHNGEPIEEWTDYVMSKFNYLEAMQILSDLDTEFESIENYAKVVNGCFLMFKISKPTTYDVEIDPRTIRRNINLLKYKLNYDISTSIINSSRASKWKKCRYRNNIITIYKSNARK